MRYTVEVRKENGEVVQCLGSYNSIEVAENIIDNFVDSMAEPVEFLDVYINDDVHSVLHPEVGSTQWFVASYSSVV